jgi:hypothetical protein
MTASNSPGPGIVNRPLDALDLQRFGGGFRFDSLQHRRGQIKSHHMVAKPGRDERKEPSP